MAQIQNDPVNHPSHYTDGKIEVIDFIEDKKLNFHRGNAVKYISRAGKKDPTKEKEDIKKAIWYLQRDVQRMEAAELAKPEAIDDYVELNYTNLFCPFCGRKRTLIFDDARRTISVSECDCEGARACQNANLKK